MSASTAKQPAAPAGPRPSISPAVVSMVASPSPSSAAQLRVATIFAAAMLRKVGGTANSPTMVPSVNSRPTLHDITTPTARSVVALTLVAPRAV